jgi:penicillin-binding protein 1A
VAVPIFGDFMTRSQIDKPVIPFRRPNDILLIPVHAETGERVLPGDENAIIEVFKPGQRPGGVLIDVPRSADDTGSTVTGGALTTQGLF